MSVNENKHSWLLDTGASLSVIRSDLLSRSATIYRDETTIKGIGGQVKTTGYVYLNISPDNHNIMRHKFYVFDTLPCSADGILGLDFLDKYRSKINLDTNYLQMYCNDNELYVPLYYTNKLYMNKNNFLIIPARSESIHYIEIDKSMTDDCVVCARELEKDVFLASTIVKPNKGIIPIQILNTSDKDITIPTFQPEIHEFSKYDVCTFNRCESKLNRKSKLLNLLKLDHLNTEEKESLLPIFEKYSDIFYLPGDKLTTTNVYQQKIHLKPNTSPVYVKPYRLPHALKPEIKKNIEKMIADDIIEECQSEWSSPILLVPKKNEEGTDKQWRLVVDFRKVNDTILDDKFPLPNIIDILDSLSNSIYFSHCDLQQAYYQVSLSPDSRKVTAFTTDTGQYQMKRLPMGMKTSPSAFSRAMTVALSGLTYEKCLVYLDDLVVFGRNLETHNRNLFDVFERLRKVNLKLNPSKCQFLKKEVLYLGHVVSAEGVKPDPQKISVLKDYPTPKCTDDVKRFVAFCNYYRKFIPSFSETAMPLNKLTRKDERFVWSEQCEQAFQKLKTALTTPPVLQYPNFNDNHEFILQTDASGVAVAAVLCNSDLRPVAYASRPLNQAERNYPTIQKELVAIVWGIKYFRPYLYGRKFTVKTDHRPLVYLFGMKDPSSRLLKFRLALEEYDFKIEYVKGKDNAVADALSRMYMTMNDLKSMNEKIMTVMTRAQSKKMQDANKQTDSTQNARTEHRTDHPRVVEMLNKPDFTTEMMLIEEKELQEYRKHNLITAEAECFALNESRRILYINLSFKALYTRAVFVQKLKKFCNERNIKEIYIIKDKENALFIKNINDEIQRLKVWSGPRICILKGVKRIDNDEEKALILHDFHLLPTSGHAGVRRMVNTIKRRFYWPSLEKDIRELIRKCDKCQKMKYSKHIKEPMVITTTSTYAFEKIFLDIVGPIEEDYSGYKYILTIQCELSKFIEAYPLKNKESETVARNFVNNFILRYSIPKIIATDRGSEFMSSVMTDVCKLLEIDKLNSTSYHHQSIGALENTHKNLGAFLRIQCDGHPETWSHWLPFWCYTYNNTVHSATKYTPFELVFGRTSNLPKITEEDVQPLYNPDYYPFELRYRLQVAHSDARNNVLKSKNERKNVYDKSVNPVTYAKDDLILVRNETANKLDCLYDGPFVVIEDIEPNVKILKNNKIDIIHKNRTKPFIQ